MATQKNSKAFYIVGIGASAGGLSAFESFFSGMPSEQSNMAFVLVQHLAPDHKSILHELIEHYTSLKVFEVSDGIRVAPNCIYIIPPNFNMELFKGTLQLIKPTKAHGHRLPIDHFFHSLAQDQGERAIGIILSGTGHDGTQGIQAIKKAGGMVMVQSVHSAEFSGMPQSAIDTGFVDFELPADAMIVELLKQTTSPSKFRETLPLQSHDANTLNKIYMLLRKQTTHDFSQYKPSTIGRRIERRMLIHKIDTIEAYYHYLQHDEDEVEALFHELLIGVTNFFRDPEAFASLQNQIIPKLFSEKSEDTSLRVWVSGCSSGEEAYSIAILLVEYMQGLKKNIPIQIFATDIDPRAIASARSGVYPESIAEHVSQERLERFFIKNSENHTYRIQKNVRDLLIFSTHDVIKDPPFSKIDLISCRNLLIYLDVELQQKLITLFYYALKHEGFLFLGASENIGELSHLFMVLDQKAKLFTCKKNATAESKIMMTHLTPTREQVITPQYLSKTKQPLKLPLRELTEKAILDQIAPAALLINEAGDILYQHGKTGSYLELPSGEVLTNNIFKMAREGLNQDLVLAFHQVKAHHQIVHINKIRIKSNGYYMMLNLTIRPVKLGDAFGSNPLLYLVMLEDVADADEYIDSDTAQSAADVLQENDKAKALKKQLLLQKEFLQEANDKLGISNEELKSYIEEIQSMNEELQSTNEELETSKEELQSLNEELSTVNTELNTKVTDLSRSNNDMNNLLAGTGIGTVFVDLNLKILRFTPDITHMINLILSDIGRPLGHIVSNLLEYDDLLRDTQKVLDTLIPKEREVKTREGHWFLMRIQPYRTMDNVIEGAVISFVNISELVSTREELEKVHHLSRLATVVNDSNDAITVHDKYGKIIAWNPGAQRLYGWSEEEALRMNIEVMIPKKRQDDELYKLKQLSHSRILEPYLTQRLNKKGELLNVSINATALIDEHNEVYAIATTERGTL